MFNNPYFGAFQQGTSGYQTTFQQNTNILPPQQVIQVNGKASVDTIRLAPNSSVLVMDTSAPRVWLCVSDGVGRVSAVPYQILEEKEETPQNANMAVWERVKALEDKITAIEEKMSHESDVQPVKSK